MSLRKSPTLTPALRAANRRNAQKSTGPRTERGKNWSRVNPLRTGRRSNRYGRFVDAILATMPGEVRRTAQATLPPHLACHPLYVEFLEGILETDRQLGAEFAERRARRERLMKTTFQAGISVKTNDDSVHDAARAPASAATFKPKEESFQAGMLLKRNAALASGGNRTWKTGASEKPGPPVSTETTKNMTFQPGISLKTDRGSAQNVRLPVGGATKPAWPNQRTFAREPNGKTTFKAGMLLKIGQISTKDVRGPVGGATQPALSNRPALAREPNGKKTFQPGMSLKTDEFSDRNVERVTEMARRMGMPKAFFDWVDREIRGKSNIPTRNVIQKKEGL
jgi:hypothetical protein